MNLQNGISSIWSVRGIKTKYTKLSLRNGGIYDNILVKIACAQESPVILTFCSAKRGGFSVLTVQPPNF